MNRTSNRNGNGNGEVKEFVTTYFSLPSQQHRLPKILPALPRTSLLRIDDIFVFPLKLNQKIFSLFLYFANEFRPASGKNDIQIVKITQEMGIGNGLNEMLFMFCVTSLKK